MVWSSKKHHIFLKLFFYNEATKLEKSKPLVSRPILRLFMFKFLHCNISWLPQMHLANWQNVCTRTGWASEEHPQWWKLQARQRSNCNQFMATRVDASLLMLSLSSMSAAVKWREDASMTPSAPHSFDSHWRHCCCRHSQLCFTYNSTTSAPTAATGNATASFLCLLSYFRFFGLCICSIYFDKNSRAMRRAQSNVHLKCNLNFERHWTCYRLSKSVCAVSSWRNTD